ncbi:MAG: hypothetical protein A2X49_09645 [Lentisphaerae bacterium GWF2_52_8]|nr:MAG: hypothetical protein A2X49_09645 [Lentisphaerae bacterium GWF2_52_8]
MANEEKALSPELKIISGLMLDRESIKLRTGLSKIIHKGESQGEPGNRQIVGGDAPGAKQDCPPTIIIEKKGEQIAKIIVKCPCGRHSELLCEYNE